jgi:hypothetical protein
MGLAGLMLAALVFSALRASVGLLVLSPITATPLGGFPTSLVAVFPVLISRRIGHELLPPIPVLGSQICSSQAALHRCFNSNIEYLDGYLAALRFNYL